MSDHQSQIKITILGSGTSTGVPLIGCNCPVCRSDDMRNKRSRSSILISFQGKNILVDTATDLRWQALANGIKRIDAVLFTHHHADHVHGIDELRSFNFIQKSPIPCYGNAMTLERIRAMFSYIFDPSVAEGGGIPKIEMSEIDKQMNVAGIDVMPLEVLHGDDTILAYRFGTAAYVTDCSGIPTQTMGQMQGLDLLVLGALRYTRHSKHFNLDEALDVVRVLKPKRTIFTHMSHEIDYEKTSSELPASVSLAYDGQTIEINGD